ncbi:MAG TPA: 2'-5' RNA ligase family protein [Chloroflexota bacterium]|nr:2'-5' RNA ligase family protein [Chloroflexota bacterium]
MTALDSLRGRAVIICPPLPEPNRIGALRRRFDPLAEVIPAHITLVFPFESDLAADDLRAHVEAAVRGVGPFPIRLRGVTPIESRYLFLLVERGDADLIELHDRLYTGPLLPYLSAAFTFVPHVTIGRLPTPDALAEALEVATAGTPIDVETRATSVVVVRATADGGPTIETEIPL